MARQGDRAIRLQADTFERLVLGQMHETVGPQDGRRSGRVLPQGALRQDRVAHRRRRPVGADLRERPDRVRAAADHVRREGRRRFPASRRRHRPLRRPRRDRQGSGNRPACRRADDALPGARSADGCRVRRAARRHRRGRRAHRRRCRPRDPGRRARRAARARGDRRHPRSGARAGRTRRSPHSNPFPTARCARRSRASPRPSPIVPADTRGRRAGSHSTSPATERTT